MRRWIMKPLELKVRLFADFMIEINEYLAALPRSNKSDKNWWDSIEGNYFEQYAKYMDQASVCAGF